MDLKRKRNQNTSREIESVVTGRRNGRIYKYERIGKKNADKLHKPAFKKSIFNDFQKDIKSNTQQTIFKPIGEVAIKNSNSEKRNPSKIRCT